MKGMRMGRGVRALAGLLLLAAMPAAAHAADLTPASPPAAAAVSNPPKAEWTV
jgi:hypothetical protein